MFQKFAFIFTLLICLVNNRLYGQSSICAGGDNISNGNGEISFTIGTIDYMFIESNEYNIYGGIQQPFELFTNSSKILNASNLKIYPNPVLETLTIESSNFETLEIEIHNQMGQVCFLGELPINKTNINLSHLPQGIYIIHFKNTSNKSIKFIKS
jgi:hypothetical protein